MSTPLLETASFAQPLVGRLIDLIGQMDVGRPVDTDGADELAVLVSDPAFEELLVEVVHADVFEELVAQQIAASAPVEALGDLRLLKSVLTMSATAAVGTVARLVAKLEPDAAAATQLRSIADTLVGTELGRRRFADVLGERDWIDSAAVVDPHITAATSPYRRSSGHVVAADDDRVVEAVMTQQTFTSLRVVDGALEPDCLLLADTYRSHGRCVAFVDENVAEHHGDSLRAYFDHHDIALEVLVHRAMEVDKGIATVETMLGELKRHGVSRHEPVLVMGGGVLSDTAGLACSLYHRSTPYVMLSTSLVAGIDAGPSPRTCCDGFGYKNLFGAYHPPVLSITDRSFFSTLRTGWLRHGFAEVAKMAIVDDVELFELLETHGDALIATKFGTVADGSHDLAEVGEVANRVVGAAVRSYVGAEYDNLYETHQLRPHAYGHTWSPGFEIAAGLLHGHAVSIGMGFGAYLSCRNGLLDEQSMTRILDLLSSLGLSLWNDVLDDRDIVWTAQERMVEKRGGALFAPVPSGRIGEVAYLDAPERAELDSALDAYRTIVRDHERGGVGIEPLCSDVGLDDPSIVGESTTDPAAPPLQPPTPESTQ